MIIDIAHNPWRTDFPILEQTINAHPLVYLDSAASSQKPRVVIEAMQHYYEHDHANVHRGIHTLSERATQAYEQARASVKQFIHAKHHEEIVFVRGTTEAINLIAQTFGKAFLEAGDEIILTRMEHHANIVPWQMLASEYDIIIKVLPFNTQGELCIEQLEKLISSKTKLISVTHVSNVLGTINPIKSIIDKAHAHDVPVLIDGAQAVPHMNVDVQALDCDFYCFSAHKMYGPTGIGVLYGKKDWLEKLPPYQGGGEMITQVSFETGSHFQSPPHKFEAGTPAIAEAIGLKAACDYLTVIGLSEIQTHEQALFAYAREQLAKLPDLHFIGDSPNKTGVIAFTFADIHPHDIATILNDRGIAVRAGHHCAMPIVSYYGIAATTRLSLGLYNQQSDIDALVEGLQDVRKIFQ